MHELNKHLWDAGNEIKKSFEMKLEKIKKKIVLFRKGHRFMQRCNTQEIELRCSEFHQLG